MTKQNDKVIAYLVHFEKSDEWYVIRCSKPTSKLHFKAIAMFANGNSHGLVKRSDLDY